MADTSRRDLFKAIAAGALVTPVALLAKPVADAACTPQSPRWGKGPEGQRIADLGDGTYLNPIVAGDQDRKSVV